MESEYLKYQASYNNNNNNIKIKYLFIYLLTAIGLSPGGSGYFTCTRIWRKKEKKKELENLSPEGYMRSM